MAIDVIKIMRSKSGLATNWNIFPELINFGADEEDGGFMKESEVPEKA